MPRRFSAEDEDRLIAQYIEGVPLSVLGSQEGCCLETVRKMLARRGVERRSRGATASTLDVEQQKRLVSDYKSGMVQTQLARKYGVSQISVSRYLRSAGVKMRLYGVAASGYQKCGGRIVTQGYVQVRLPLDSPMASMRNNIGYVFEHRLVMAEHIGRPLRPDETIHHIDGNKQNNSIENLELRQGNHGTHARFRCADCGSVNVEPY